MKQMMFAATGLERYGKTTRRSSLLAEMEQVVPWHELCRLIEPVYRKLGKGRPPPLPFVGCSKSGRWL
jgi:IS5 family transposase